MGRLTPRSLAAARTLARTLFDDFQLVEVDASVADRACELASLLALRGYDAVHLASFEGVEVDDSILVAADGALAAAGRRNGHAVAVPG